VDESGRSPPRGLAQMDAELQRLLMSLARRKRACRGSIGLSKHEG
jgi:hypothetical protein